MFAAALDDLQHQYIKKKKNQQGRQRQNFYTLAFTLYDKEFIKIVQSDDVKILSFKINIS